MPYAQFRWRRTAALAACAAASSLALIVPAAGSAFASTGIKTSLSPTTASPGQKVALTIGSFQNTTDPNGTFTVAFSAEAAEFVKANAGTCSVSGKYVTCKEYMNGNDWKYDVLHFRVTKGAVPGSSFAFHVTATSNGTSTNDAVTLNIAAVQTVTAQAPTVTRATCRHGGRLFIPDVKGVDYTIHGDTVNGETIHRPGRYHVHAVAAPGYQLTGDTNWYLRVHRSRHCLVTLRAKAVRHHHRNVVWELFRTRHSSERGTHFRVHVNRHNGWHGGTYYGRHVLRHGQQRLFFSTHHGGRLRVAYHDGRGDVRFAYATSYGY